MCKEPASAEKGKKMSTELVDVDDLGPTELRTVVRLLIDALEMQVWRVDNDNFAGLLVVKCEDDE